MKTTAKNLNRHLEALGPFDPSDMSLREARAIRRAFYVDGLGYASPPRLLTLPESQHKLGMSARRAVGLTLAPADMSGEWDACTWRTAACTAACVLATAGKGVFENVREGRRAKTRFLADHPQAFVTLLDAELRAQVAAHGPIDFRPNVASDVRWENVAPMLLEIPQVRVYDYTKAPAAQRTPSENYRLVFSVSERARSTREALDYLRSGSNAAVVFATIKGHALPATWHGFDVIDADTSDSRFDDPAGVVVGLRAKGSARGVIGRADGFVKEGVAS
jgi:hypothetical protein